MTLANLVRLDQGQKSCIAAVHSPTPNLMSIYGNNCPCVVIITNYGRGA